MSNCATRANRSRGPGAGYHGYRSGGYSNSNNNSNSGSRAYLEASSSRSSHSGADQRVVGPGNFGEIELDYTVVSGFVPNGTMVPRKAVERTFL